MSVNFHDAFVAKMLNLVEYRNEKEMWWNKDAEERTTIEFIGDSPDHAIVRRYCYPGAPVLCMEFEYRNGLLNGISTQDFFNGKRIVMEYKNGHRHGKSIVYEGGAIIDEADWINGVRVDE